MKTKRRTAAKLPPRRQLGESPSSPAAKTKDSRGITITGYDSSGKVVAEDRTAESWKAGQIAANWRESGLDVAIVEKTIAQD